jgi:hypothetical protein
MFAPWYEEVSEQHTDVVFAKVDTEAEQALAGSFGIRSIPTLMAFRDGILLYKEAGALPKEALSQLVDQVKALDMDDVRRQVAEAEAAAGAHDHAGHAALTTPTEAVGSPPAWVGLASGTGRGPPHTPGGEDRHAVVQDEKLEPVYDRVIRRNPGEPSSIRPSARSSGRSARCSRSTPSTSTAACSR